MDRTHDGRAIKTLTVIDEYTRECLALVVDRRLRSDDILFRLADLFLEHGTLDHIRSDNAPLLESRTKVRDNCIERSKIAA